MKTKMVPVVEAKQMKDVLILKKTADDIPIYCHFDKLIPTKELKPNPRNPNQHPPEQIELLGKIIKVAGWRERIVVSLLSGLIVKGHGRWRAAKQFKLTECPVEYQYYDSLEQEYADMLADNRIAELSENNRPILKDLLEELNTGEMEMFLTGYNEEALENLMTEFHQEIEKEKEKDESVVTKSCPSCGYILQ